MLYFSQWHTSVGVMQISVAVTCHRFRLWKQLAYSRACTQSTLSSRSFQPPPLFRLCYAPKLITAPSLMKANPVSRHCGGGGRGAGLSMAKLAGDVFFRACQSGFQRKCQRVLTSPQTWKSARCFTSRLSFLVLACWPFNTLNAGLPKLVMACNNSL